MKHLIPFIFLLINCNSVVEPLNDSQVNDTITFVVDNSTVGRSPCFKTSFEVFDDGEYLGKVLYKDMRVFEVFAGSRIRADYTNLCDYRQYSIDTLVWNDFKWKLTALWVTNDSIID